MLLYVMVLYFLILLYALYIFYTHCGNYLRLNGIDHERDNEIAQLLSDIDRTWRNGNNYHELLIKLCNRLDELEHPVSDHQYISSEFGQLVLRNVLKSHHSGNVMCQYVYNRVNSLVGDHNGVK